MSKKEDKPVNNDRYEILSKPGRGRSFHISSLIDKDTGIEIIDFGHMLTTAEYIKIYNHHQSMKRVSMRIKQAVKQYRWLNVLNWLKSKKG